LIHVYTFVTSSEDVREAKERLEACKHNIAIDHIVYNVAKRLLDKYNSKIPLLRYLRKIIEVDWKNFFYDGGVPKALCDMTNCVRGADAPSYEAGYYLTITDECPTNCKISDFWKTKQTDLQNLSQIDTSKFTGIKDPKRTMSKTKQEAQAILGGKSPHGEPCRNLSDTVISIEARDGYPGITIHSMDYDFELLKDVLNTQVRFLRV
jgi:hypothetical protein